MDEAQFWMEYGIDPAILAMALYRVTGQYERGCQIVELTRERARAA